MKFLAKNIYKAQLRLMIVASLVLFFGCDGQLDVDPQQSIDESIALITSANVEAALVGAYDALGERDVYAGELFRDSELLADSGEVLWQGTFLDPRQFFRKALQVDNTNVTEAWLEMYEAIDRANNVLSALDVVDPGIVNRVEGEAKFIRGTVYFELVKVFAKTWQDGDPGSNPGVPIVLEPTGLITEENNVPRSTVAEVYQQVINDLTDAASLLPATNGFFATTNAASAMLSRVYLMQGDYAAAAAAADRVIQSGQYDLVAEYADAFNNASNTDEDILAMQVSSQDGENRMNTFFAPAEDSGRGDIPILDAHLALYEVGDERLDLFYVVDGETWTGKWADQFGIVNVIRYAEMFLTRAEANFREGTTVGDTPLNDINTIRARAGLPDLGGITLDQILLERKLELAFEGHAIHDLKRTQRPVGTIPFDANELVYPIPQRELDANPGLGGQQNPGY